MRRSTQVASGNVGRFRLFTLPAGRSPYWVKVKNPKAPAMKREAEEDWRR
jgi:hypothetical protein